MYLVGGEILSKESVFSAHTLDCDALLPLKT